jgi:hypothetical protein
MSSTGPLERVLLPYILLVACHFNGQLNTVAFINGQRRRGVHKGFKALFILIKLCVFGNYRSFNMYLTFKNGDNLYAETQGQQYELSGAFQRESK